jgi:hypothetical protein
MTMAQDIASTWIVVEMALSNRRRERETPAMPTGSRDSPIPTPITLLYRFTCINAEQKDSRKFTMIVDDHQRLIAGA